MDLNGEVTRAKHCRARYNITKVVHTRENPIQTCTSNGCYKSSRKDIDAEQILSFLRQARFSENDEILFLCLVFTKLSQCKVDGKLKGKALAMTNYYVI